VKELRKLYNKLFDEISEEKKNRIINAAIIEFANNGFSRSNINNIAKNADISIGSLYKYFNNKHDLFLSIVNFNVEKTKTVLEQIISESTGFISTVNEIISAIQKYSRIEVHATKLYNIMTTEHNADLVWQIASNMEGVTANLYANLIQKAQEEGTIRKDINAKYYAFFLDNLFILLQFSYSCEYYQERLKLYIDEKAFENDELLSSELIKFIKGAFFIDWSQSI